MVQSAFEHYQQQNKLYPFRELCNGYLLIGKNNAQATLILLKANLVHQIYYISRNMFEMVVTLYYIDDDPSKRDDLIKRYFEYNEKVIPYKFMNKLKKYPDILDLSKEAKKQITEGNIMFYEKYKQIKKDKTNKATLNTETWSVPAARS